MNQGFDCGFIQPVNGAVNDSFLVLPRLALEDCSILLYELIRLQHLETLGGRNVNTTTVERCRRCVFAFGIGISPSFGGGRKRIFGDGAGWIDN